MPNRTRHYDADFMMTSFKVKLCPRGDQHNWKACPWKHEGESQATRRHPSLYSPAYCANLKMHGKCAAGDRCPFSHNTFELSLHPERYKTTLCNLGEACNRDICFFAHSISELRTPGSSTLGAGSNPKTPQASLAAARQSATSEPPVPTSSAAAAWNAPTSAGAAAGGGSLPLLFPASQLEYHQQHLLAQEHMASVTAQHVMAAQVAASAAAAAAAAVLAPAAGPLLSSGSQLHDWVEGLPASGNALGNPAASYGVELAAAADSFTSQGSSGSSVCNYLPLQAQLAAAASLPLAQSAAGTSLFWPQLDIAAAGKNIGQQVGGMPAAVGEDSLFGCLGQANLPVHVRAMLLGAASGVVPNAAWPSYP